MVTTDEKVSSSSTNMKVPSPLRPKLAGWEFWRETLGSPKYVVAPMVDQSALAWRLLSRRHGAQLCYTPMFHSRLFAENAQYRRKEFTSCPEDRPLIVQFSGNDPDTLVRAAKLVEDQCDAVDLNLGCPQGIAKKGHYGSYLQDEWDLIKRIVERMHAELAVPVTCKIRIFPSVERTIAYARMIRDAGCQMLTVHGRLREQRGQATGLADWDQIRAVVEALDIPVIANGNILFHGDIQQCLEYTKAAGVMTAEGNLYNPCIFEPTLPLIHDVVTEYLEICRHHETPLSYMRGHLFKLFRPALAKYTQFRDPLGSLHEKEELYRVADQLCSILRADHQQQQHGDGYPAIGDIPHYYCQPYIRPLPAAEKKTDQPTTNAVVIIEDNLERPSKMVKIDLP